MKRIVAVVLMVVFAAAGAWAFRPAPKHPNIILISVDTLRADYFAPEYMPLTYQWAQEHGTIFTNAYANSTCTFPSHVSMLTGKLASEQGITKLQPLPDSLNFISEALKNKGYHTYFFGADGWICPAFNFAQGFDYRRFFDWETSYDDRAVQLQWATETRMKKPFFAFIHTVMIHQYWLRNYSDWKPEYSGRKNVLNLPDEMFQYYFKWRSTASINERRISYAQTVHDFDILLAKFLDAMNREDTFIIVTSDHGEGLGEKHGDTIFLDHGLAPYPNQTHVPLLVVGNAESVSAPVGLDQLFDTIIRVADGDSFSIMPRTVVSEADEFRAEITKDHYTVSKDKSDHVATVEVSTEKIPESTRNALKALGYLQ